MLTCTNSKTLRCDDDVHVQSSLYPEHLVGKLITVCVPYQDKNILETGFVLYVHFPTHAMHSLLQYEFMNAAMTINQNTLIKEITSDNT